MSLPKALAYACFFIGILNGAAARQDLLRKCRASLRIEKARNLLDDRATMLRAGMGVQMKDNLR
ncbi:MAG: hypothetical protein BGN83_10965 [Rhizobium sp. 63-7]|nr:MAG: hypothetical protein BGN83_10965 [Rhizobium sp. 63-7]